MTTTAQIPVTPGAGLILDAVQVTVAATAVDREVVVIGDPNTAADLANVTAAGALQVDGSAVTQPVSGTVAVNNFPATQPISGSVSITGTPTVDIAAAQTIAVTQATGSNLHTVLDSGTVTAVTAITDALPAGTNTIGKVDILGNAGAVLDSTTGAATTPTDALAVSCAYVSTPPALTTGQSVAAQCDSAGSQFVHLLRRSQVKYTATTIATTAATTVFAAQASGIYADIGTIVATVVSSTTSAPFTAQLKDGTNTYVFNLNPDAAVGSQQLYVNFQPPIPATTAATAWTVTQSTASSTSYVIGAVLETAS